MQQKLKKEWIDALKSGKYKQGQYTLRNRNDEYCCLGVLADVCDNTGWSRYADIWLHSNSGGSSAYLSISDLDMQTQLVLTEMNDSRKDFLEIADWIEKNL